MVSTSLAVTSFETRNRFRSLRGKVLRSLVAAIADHFGRDIRILDVGGRPDYWSNVGFENIAHIEISNLDASELKPATTSDVPRDMFIASIRDARDLSGLGDKSVDLVHANSVIEHVGGWDDMAAMAREMQRVGRAGWVQTPAWSFPLEPHFRVPFMHWFARPLQARAMTLSFVKSYREMGPAERRQQVERINLLGRREVELLFPDKPLYVERFILAKSYSAYWLPSGQNFSL